MKVKDLTGQVFGQLTVLSFVETRPIGKSNSKRAYWLCKCSCGTEKVVAGVNLRNKNTTSCGCRKRDMLREFRKHQTGPKHPRWKGGRNIQASGYVTVWTEGKGIVKEHVHVMSQHLGRELLRGENVHHVNGIRDDNRIENLELWIKPQPNGCRAADAVEWATEILRRYAPERLTST